jgi:hypothetical protein
VIECAPGVRLTVENVATPEPFKVPVPIAVAPSLNVTVPVGVGAPLTVPATVAVKVTDVPAGEGFRLDVSVVVVFCWTVCVRAVEVLPVLFPSPP